MMARQSKLIARGEAEPYRDDHNQATRYAVFRCAVIIGRAMKPD